MPVDLDALKELYTTMLDHIQHAKWTAANRDACKIADDIPALIAELRENRAAVMGAKSVIKHADQCKQELADALARIAELQAANRWRPIAEGLPEDNVNVLVWDGERACKAFRRHGSWLGDGLYLSRKITHWRALPDPPESV